MKKKLLVITVMAVLTACNSTAPANTTVSGSFINSINKALSYNNSQKVILELKSIEINKTYSNKKEQAYFYFRLGNFYKNKQGQLVLAKQYYSKALNLNSLTDQQKNEVDAAIEEIEKQQ